jgi:hypothetical protein
VTLFPSLATELSLIISVVHVKGEVRFDIRTSSIIDPKHEPGALNDIER